MDSADLLRYGLYALTAVLGVVLLLWIRHSQKQQKQRRRRSAERSRPTVEVDNSTRIRAVRGMPSTASMAEAIAGIRLPVHWQPDPPVEVASPFTLTTKRETAGEMADTLSDELERLGYRVTPTGGTSARAVRDINSITVEVETDDDAGFVSSRLTLTEAGRG